MKTKIVKLEVERYSITEGHDQSEFKFYLNESYAGSVNHIHARTIAAFETRSRAEEFKRLLDNEYEYTVAEPA